jgi:hypothetical protein
MVFTLCEEANHEAFFDAARRAAKKLGQGMKLLQREFRQFELTDDPLTDQKSMFRKVQELLALQPR